MGDWKRHGDEYGIPSQILPEGACVADCAAAGQDRSGRKSVIGMEHAGAQVGVEIIGFRVLCQALAIGDFGHSDGDFE